MNAHFPSAAAARIARLPAQARETLRILFVAKHVFWQGGLHHEDGNHAIYHCEIRDTLKAIGVNLALADSYEALFSDPGCDFVFPLLNRGGFLNSEMLLPLLATRLGLPFLGSSPILRGLSDDKHLTKLEAQARGVPTAPWAIYRRGAPVLEAAAPMAGRMVVKPNASSASWGVRDASGWTEVKRAVSEIHDEGHDAIVEPFINGHDIEVPVITSNGLPAPMPMIMFEQADPSHLRTHSEKRGLGGHAQTYRLVPFDDPRWVGRISGYTQRMAGIFHPFDYGRYEFRLDDCSGELRLLEVNLNCNLWSEKVIGQSAALLGWTHADLIETILCESLERQGLLSKAAAFAD